MDISTTATATSVPAIINTPEAETEASVRIQSTRPLSFTNGLLKRRHHHHRRENPPVVVSYKECLKNHAANLGSHSVDGCGEFMPSPTATPTDPTSLKCDACGCHRNFHRRQPEDPLSIVNTAATAHHVIEYHPHHRHHPPPPPARGGGHSPPNSPSPPPISSSYYPSAPHMLLALSSGVSGLPPENNPSIATPAGATAAVIGNPNGRKRFRTKFTRDQKGRMHEFAERIGWKMQKGDDESITEFCSEIGVNRGVLKVWMHNNKYTLGKKDAYSDGFGIDNGSRNDLKNTTATQNHYQHNGGVGNDNKTSSENLSDDLHNSYSVSPLVVAGNGSSSSS